MFGSGTMIRWREALILALLVLSPVRAGSDEDDDDNDSDGDGGDEDETDDDGEPSAMKELPNRRGIGGVAVAGVNLGRAGSSGVEAGEGHNGLVRRPTNPTVSQAITLATRTMRRPLECYVCSYKSDSFLRSCLDPTKFRVHTMACHNVEDKCFTAVTSRGSSYEAIMRGCRSGCVATPETSCCATDRCNNQAMAMPVIAPKGLVESPPRKSKAAKPIPPTVLFFVSVLLVLQTVVKVAVV